MMNAFDVIEKQFFLLEIRPLQPSQKFAFNGKNVAILFLISMQVVTVLLFLAIEASNYDDYFGSLFISLTALTTVFSYFVFISQRNNIFKLITDLNGFATKRKINSLGLNYGISKFLHDISGSKIPNTKKIYKNSSRKINELMQKFHFCMLNLSLNFGFASVALICTFNYIRTDFDETALALPVLMW